MKHKKHQNTVLEARSEEAPQSTKRGISRRHFVQTSAGAVAAGALLGKRAFAASRPLKIGYVSTETGALASFGECDAFIIDQLRKKFQGGIMSGGATRPVEILVRDCQSSSNRAAQVTASLIKSDKVDLVLVSSPPDYANPVADQCELNQMPCVSTNSPVEPYFFGRGGKPDKGFDWTYNFFWSVDAVGQATCDIFSLVPTNKVVGILMGNDLEGNLFSDPVHGHPALYTARGYKVIDPGRFQLNTNDFSAQIAVLKKGNCEILNTSVPLPTFSNFWAQAAQQGYRPKIGCIGKALQFPSAVEALGPRGKYLSVSVWWTPAFPFKSSLTGQSARQLCDQYEEVTKKEWTIDLGLDHALFEVAFDAFKRAQNPESASSVIEAVRTTRLNTVVGPVQWQGPPLSQWVTIPVKNVCTIPIVAAQWVPGKKWMYDCAIVDNGRCSLIPVERKMEPLPA